jgi:uncharacterized protein (UPF0276 family)
MRRLASEARSDAQRREAWVPPCRPGAGTCKVGVGFRRELAGWIESRPEGLGCLELTAEHFFDAPDAVLERIAAGYPITVHGLGLSLGTPGPLDPGLLAQLARVARLTRPLWVSEHVAFTRTAQVDLGHLNPLRPDARTLDRMVDHAAELRERCGCDVVLENIATYVRIEGDMPETEFLNRLCERAGTGLLLDVTNLYVNARNHRFDPFAWLEAIEPRFIRQLHVVGYSEADGVWHDRHADPIQDELWPLLRAALAHARPEVVILERDGNFADLAALGRELGELARAVCAS